MRINSIADLDYKYPEELVAQAPIEPCRNYFGSLKKEISRQELLDLIKPEDVLVINETKVEKRRIFSKSGVEILFLNSLSSTEWEVLFPARDFNSSDVIALPGDITMRLKARGLPQRVELSSPLTANYFNDYGDLALPPYIQKARDERRSRPQDDNWYQTDWAKTAGSTASPTASLHFKRGDLATLVDKGVHVEKLTLHVGMGTFLPIKVAQIEEHQMHQEYYEIPLETLNKIEIAKAKGARIWALGTTVARALETYAISGERQGATDLFIKPGFEWRVVSGLLTNFHQPKSTLLCLVAAFAGSLQSVLDAYQDAIDKKFRLFSYGDLTVWIK